MRYSWLLALSACTSELVAVPADEPDWSTSMAVTIDAGEEATFCRYAVMPAEGAKLAKTAHRYTDVSHHLILYLTRLDAASVSTEPFDCSDGTVLEDVIGAVYAAQHPEGSLELPEGVALDVAPSQVMMLEYHVVNTRSERIDAEASVETWFGDAGDTLQAGALFYFDDYIVLPPQSSSTAAMRCEVPADIEILFATPHMHEHGTGFEARVRSDAGDSLLVDDAEWSSDTSFHFDPPVSVAGGSTIDYRCAFENASDRAVFDGPSAVDDEMCVLFAVYYRPDGDRLGNLQEVCEIPGSGPYFAGGTASCEVARACDRATWWDTDDPLSEQAQIDRWMCHSAMCEAAWEAFQILGACESACGEPCWEEQDPLACDACLASECAAELAACAAAACDPES